jgi:hypothetical protein
MFFRFVTSGEIQRRAEFFEPFISGLTNSTVLQVSLLVLIFIFICNTSNKNIVPGIVYLLSINSTPSCSPCKSILLLVIILRCISIVQIESVVLAMLILSDPECCETG